MDFTYYVKQQKLWSLETFGEGQRSDGICKHIASELEEIKEHPSDLTEWIDVIILAIDGAWRMGFTPEEIETELRRKQLQNQLRKWPPREVSEANQDKPTFHIKTDEDKGEYHV